MSRTYGITPDAVMGWPLSRWLAYKHDMDREISESRKAAKKNG